MSPRTILGAAVSVHVGVKLLLSALVPLIGDEAYYVLWGLEPAMGYYDHPPMIGWWLAPIVRLGDAPVLWRLPAVVATAAVGIGIYLLSRRSSRRRAALTAALFLATPIYVLEILVLPDVPLLVFSFAAGAVLALSLDRPLERPSERSGLWLFAVAGFCLGLALISKYLAALLAVGFALVLGARIGEPRLRRGVVVLAACAAVPLAVNLAWNVSHCWTNVVFNLFTRHVGEAERYTLWNTVYYLAVIAVTVTPPIWMALGRRRRRLRELLDTGRGAVWTTLALFPLAAIGLGSLVGPAGVHWVLSFAPFAFLVVGEVLTERQLRRALTVALLLSTALVAAVVGAASAPSSAWTEAGFHESYVMMRRGVELVERAEEAAPGARLAAVGYSPASLLSLAADERVPVFGTGSHYGRQDDLAVDWRRFEGADLAILSKRPVSAESSTPYFETTDRRSLEIEGARYHLLIGRGFDFASYRARVLSEVASRYYDLPGWLPTVGCPFLTRYGLPCSTRDATVARDLEERRR